MLYETRINVAKSLRQMEVGQVDTVPVNEIREMSLRNGAFLVSREHPGRKYTVNKVEDNFVITRVR